MFHIVNSKSRKHSVQAKTWQIDQIKKKKIVVHTESRVMYTSWSQINVSVIVEDHGSYSSKFKPVKGKLIQVVAQVGQKET